MPAEIPWLNYFVQGGSFSVVAFVVYWILAKFIPEMTARFVATQEQSRKDYLDAIGSQRKDFQNELAVQRQFNKDSESITISSLKELIVAVKETGVLIAQHDKDMKLAHAVELLNKKRLEEQLKVP